MSRRREMNNFFIINIGTVIMRICEYADQIGEEEEKEEEDRAKRKIRRRRII